MPKTISIDLDICILTSLIHILQDDTQALYLYILCIRFA